MQTSIPWIPNLKIEDLNDNFLKEKKYLNENSEKKELPAIYTWLFWIVIILFVPFDFSSLTLLQTSY